MRWRLAVGLCVLTTSVFAGSPSNAQLSILLQQLVSKNNGCGGGVFRISDANGVVWEGAAGLIAGSGSPPMTPGSSFEVASITKTVTAATVLRLVEDAKLSLDARLSDLLPGHQIRGFADEITVRQLLSHTSGLPDYWTDGPHDSGGNNAFLRAFLADRGRRWEPTAILTYASSLPAKPPGSRFHYSDTNYVLLGVIIENVTKRPLNEAFSQIIFKPLGMNSTWMSYHEKPRGAGPISHRFEGREDLNATPRQSADWAGGGLVSTTRDLEKFLRGLASGRLFKNKSTLELMRKSVPTGEADITYGLGIYRVSLDNGHGEIWGHDGHGNSFAYYWPERGIFVTGTLNQTENDWWPLMDALLPDGENALNMDETDAAWSAALSAGWDSLYMYHGVNSLRNGRRYGSGIVWTELSVDWNLTDQDSFSVDAWHCLGTQSGGYREIDLSIVYTRTLGDLALSCGYGYFFGYSPDIFVSHELNATAGYALNVGPAKVIPSLAYFFTIGPDSQTGIGSAKAGSSFLLLRVDGSLPLYKDVIALEPWTAVGMNFQYTTSTGPDDETVPFTGWNNAEAGIAVPFKINKVMTISAYFAYSRALANLSDTSTDTFWGGTNITFSF